MLITPEYVFKDVTHITPEWLAAKGITALVLDIDNTLTADRSQELPDEVAGWLDTLDRLSAAAKKAEEDYASASFVLQQAHDDLDALYRQADQLGEALRTRDGELETVRLKVNMLSATHQQLDGQMAVLRGNVENNNANISRIEEELKADVFRLLHCRYCYRIQGRSHEIHW